MRPSDAYMHTYMILHATDLQLCNTYAVYETNKSQEKQNTYAIKCVFVFFVGNFGIIATDLLV